MILIIVTVLLFLFRKKTPIEDVFVITNEGLLLAHKSRELRPDMDDDIFSSMLTAIQNFVKDSLKDKGKKGINRLDFGENEVVFKEGKHVYLAVVLSGESPSDLELKLDYTIAKIEANFGHILEDWDGTAEKVGGVRDLLGELLK